MRGLFKSKSKGRVKHVTPEASTVPKVSLLRWERQAPIKDKHNLCTEVFASQIQLSLQLCCPLLMNFGCQMLFSFKHCKLYYKGMQFFPGFLELLLYFIYMSVSSEPLLAQVHQICESHSISLFQVKRLRFIQRKQIKELGQYTTQD